MAKAKAEAYFMTTVRNDRSSQNGDFIDLVNKLSYIAVNEHVLYSTPADAYAANVEFQQEQGVPVTDPHNAVYYRITVEKVETTN